MKRKIRKIVLLILLFPLLGAAISPVALKLNGKLIEETPILEKEEELFIPIKYFSDLTSLQFTQRSNGDIILFRDNVFIKFNLNTSTYFLNGKEFKWESLPFSEKREFFLPYKILLNFMNFQYSYDEEDKILTLVTGTGYDVSLRYLQNRQKVDFAEAKISYNLPFFWQRSSPNSFFSQGSEMTIEVTSSPLGEKSLDEAIQEHLDAKSLEDFKKTAPRQLFVEGKPILTHGFTKKEDQGHYYYGFSYFSLENRLVETIFYAYSNSMHSALKLEEEILLSTQFNAYTIDDMQEHYVELGAFFAMNMMVEEPLYSNMLVDNFLHFKGEIHPTLTELHASVKRGKRRFTYTFPLVEGKFDAQIPIPFGLGFHSVRISMNPSTSQQIQDSPLIFNEDEHLLLKFSLLNTSLDEGLYLSYSNLVLRDQEDITKMSSLVKDRSLDYTKAQALLLLLKENFTLGNEDEPLLALEEKTVSKKSAALIYAALLRSAGVPTKVLSNKSQTLYGVEIFSNGLWQKIDPYNFLLKDRPASNYMSLPQDYFGRDPQYYDY